MSKCLMVVPFSLIVLWLAGCGQFHSPAGESLYYIDQSVTERARAELYVRQDSGSRERIKKGTEQLALSWRASDGTPEDFYRFCTDNFVSGPDLEANFKRITGGVNLLRGSIDRIREKFTEPGQYTDIPVLRADSFIRKAIPESDIYNKGKLAPFIRLNFPHYTLAEKRAAGSHWSREKWAMVRLGDLFAQRKGRPAKTKDDEELTAFTKYMESYFVRMDHVCMPDSSFPYPPGVSLHSHRGLRDDIKEQYTRPGGNVRQALSGKVIDHIIKGTIPNEFLTDTTTRWNPSTNQLFRIKDKEWIPIAYTPEGNKRYTGLLAAFHKYRSADSSYAGTTHVERNFERQNMLEEEVEQLIRGFLSDPVIDSAAKLIERKLGRPLQPFDIWYSGFQEQGLYPAAWLDSIVRHRYPDASALQRDLPAVLHRMGFSSPEAQYLGTHIRVRPVVSGGYTKRPAFPNDTAVITTMIDPDGMDYKAYRVAMHELGHAVEMLYTANGVDNFILADVPANGITEGVAELLAYRNMDGLGLPGTSLEGREHRQALATLWYLVEMGGQALTDILTWKWLYAHPSATAADLQAAVLNISEEIWNQYYARFFGVRDQCILSIYNHFICGELYLYNYFISNVIMFQLYSAFGPDFPEGLKNACKEGNTLPDLWMKRAIGEPVTIRPLLQASKNALKYFNAFHH